MSHVLISVSTPTYAIKVKRILRSIGISGEIIKMNTTVGRGCSHAVKIKSVDLYKAAATLREQNIPYTVFEE